MRSKLRTPVVVLVVLLITGFMSRWIEGPAWRELRSRQPALQLESVQGAFGQGVTVGLLGGFRAIVADLFWIRMHKSWETNDIAATQTMIKLVSAIDPRPPYFWINGARIISYDMPNWRIDAAGGWDKVPDAAKRRFDEEQSAVGIAHVEQGWKHHPDDALFPIEIANIHLNRLKDPAAAAPYYKQASEMPSSPYYASRLYAEMLRRLDRRDEAYDWLVKLYPTLPDGNDMAMKPAVLERIRELEDELGIPPERAYRPPVLPLAPPADAG